MLHRVMMAPAYDPPSSTIVLEVLCPELGHQSCVFLQRSSTVADLKREACAEVGVQESEVDLYDAFGGTLYACLEERLGVSIATARLMDRQAVLLKGKGGRAPSPASLVHGTSWSRPPDVMLVFDDGSQLAVHRCILELSSPLLQDILAQSPVSPSPQPAPQLVLDREPTLAKHQGAASHSHPKTTGGWAPGHLQQSPGGRRTPTHSAPWQLGPKGQQQQHGSSLHQHTAPPASGYSGAVLPPATPSSAPPSPASSSSSSSSTMHHQSCNALLTAGVNRFQSCQSLTAAGGLASGAPDTLNPSASSAAATTAFAQQQQHPQHFLARAAPAASAGNHQASSEGIPGASHRLVHMADAPAHTHHAQQQHGVCPGPIAAAAQPDSGGNASVSGGAEGGAPAGDFAGQPAAVVGAVPSCSAPSSGFAASGSNMVMDFLPALSADGQSMSPHKPEDLFVLHVPSDERYSWVYCLQLLYPCCQMRRPPITWSNIYRILALADKWLLSSVLRVCEDFLLLPTSQLSSCSSDPSYVWRWLLIADRLHMPLVVRKCISFIQMARMSSGMDRQQMEKSVAEVVAQCSPQLVAQLITSLIAFKDEILAVTK